MVGATRRALTESESEPNMRRSDGVVTLRMVRCGVASSLIGMDGIDGSCSETVGRRNDPEAQQRIDCCAATMNAASTSLRCKVAAYCAERRFSAEPDMWSLFVTIFPVAIEPCDHYHDTDSWA